MSSCSSNGKVCVVTGAGSGIGRATALGLAREGADVVLMCRRVEEGEPVLRRILRHGGKASVLAADFTSLDQVRDAAATFLARNDRLDVLINNAGVCGWGRRITTQDGLEQTFAVNHLAHFLLTKLLLDRIQDSAPARIVNVSSVAHRWFRLRLQDLQGDRRWCAFGAYCRSKLANVLFTRELARRLEGTGVTTNCLHPGIVSTGIHRDLPRWLQLVLGGRLLLSPERAAERVLYLARSAEVSNANGGYFVRSRLVQPSRIARDAGIGLSLWQISEDLVK